MTDAGPSPAPQILFRSRGFVVSGSSLRTPRQTFALRNIEHVSISQPLLFAVGFVAAGLFGFMLSFFRYLYTWEIASLAVVLAVMVTAALRIGVLKVHSLALREDDGRVFGDIRTLRAVKAAVDDILSTRHHARGPD